MRGAEFITLADMTACGECSPFNYSTKFRSLSTIPPPPVVRSNRDGEKTDREWDPKLGRYGYAPRVIE